MNNAKIISVATKMAPNVLSIGEVENRILEASGTKLPVNAIYKLTGVEQVFHKNEGTNTSDLAAEAAKIALERAGLNVNQVDLIIFSSASQDLIEPATSHIVASLLGAKGVPVMDVKNACNSFLNAVQVANSFIRSGQYKTVLICSGETPSMAVRWNNKDKQQFMRSFPGFSMSDTGAAMIITASEKKGIQAIEFTSMSDKWDVGVLNMGGSRSPRDFDTTYFDMDGSKLFEAFLALGPDILNYTLGKTGHKWDDFAFIGMHQISYPYLATVCKLLHVPVEQIVVTINDYGNVTSCSLPLQLETAINKGLVHEGDDFAFIGFGGGISTGLGVFTL